MSMRYEKPPNLKYTDLCIYIDSILYKDNLTEEEKETIYKYIYCICYVLSMRAQYFKSIEDYDMFSCDFAADVCKRIFDPRQFIPKGENEWELSRVKSILNYIKSLLYVKKTFWQQANYKYILDSSLLKDFDYDAYTNQFKESIQTNYTMGMVEDIIETLHEIPNIVYKVVMNTPYKRNSSMIKRIIMSCKITLLKSFTLSNVSIKTFKKSKESNNFNINIYDILFERETRDSVTLWHINESLADYITVLCNIVKIKIKHKIRDVQLSYKLPDDTFRSMMLTALELQEGEIYEE